MMDSLSMPSEASMPKAHQACLSCKKQKRKCSKDLPICTLCQRMGRQCDYSDTTPAPSVDDIFAMQRKIIELEGRLNAAPPSPSPLNGAISTPYPESSPAAMISPLDEIPIDPALQIDPSMQPTLNKFPSLSILDSVAFSYAGVQTPKPAVSIPPEVLDILGDGDMIQAVATEYFATVHTWLPIISKKRMTQNLRNPMWEAGPDLALIFLCMRLIITPPIEGIDPAQIPAYLAAKRFLTTMEAFGMMSIHVLQAYILVAFYEMGQAIFPAAWMTSASCSRYASLLGISGHPEVAVLLGRPTTWIEKEERLRSWWAVLLLDRMIVVGSRGHALTTGVISPTLHLPYNDVDWDNGNMGLNAIEDVQTPLSEPVGPFARTCQATYLLDRALRHHQSAHASETDQFNEARELFGEISTFAEALFEETKTSADGSSLVVPTAIVMSALGHVFEPYACPDHSAKPLPSKEARIMQVTCIDGLKKLADKIVEFVEQQITHNPDPMSLAKHSPLILDSMYCSAANFAWFVRESGGHEYQVSLDSMRSGLAWLSGRWRCATEYLKFLESQEFNFSGGAES